MTTRRQRQEQARAQKRDLTLQALQLRASGATYKQIAAALGVSEPTAWRLVQQQAERMIQESAREVLALELQRLDQLQMGLWAKAINGNAQAIDRVLRIMDARARLLGLHRQPDSDQPQRDLPTDAVVVISREATQEDFIAGMRALRGELLPPPSNGNGHGPA